MTTQLKRGEGKALEKVTHLRGLKLLTTPPSALLSLLKPNQKHSFFASFRSAFCTCFATNLTAKVSYQILETPAASEKERKGQRRRREKRGRMGGLGGNDHAKKCFRSWAAIPAAE
jgi:hypothetical protein